MLASHAKQSEKLVWECFDVIIPETSTMNKETQLKLKTQNIHFFFYNMYFKCHDNFDVL